MSFIELASITSVVFQLIILEGLLSIDNAAVLAALTFHLPADTPPPKPLNLPIFKRFLGGEQRSAALKAGIFGAYVGRGIMLLLATFIIRNPFLKIVGALYLLYLGTSHFLFKENGKEAKRHGDSFWLTVLSIELADLAFSLDNVVAAVSLSNKLWVVIVGVFIGIAVMRFGATIILRLMEKEPVLAHAAYLIIIAIGAELILDQAFHINLSYLLKFIISMGLLIGTVLVTKLKRFSLLMIKN